MIETKTKTKKIFNKKSMTASELRDSITAYLDQGGDAKTLLAQLNGTSRTFALGVIDMRENPTACYI